MRENIDILGVFHDGSLVEIRGNLPEIVFRIELEYFRNMFSSKGNSFFANISGCKFIEFFNWETESRTQNFSEIEGEELEILSVEQQGEYANIICSTGTLIILYENIEFHLDTGELITYQELAEACNNYWK